MRPSLLMPLPDCLAGPGFDVELSPPVLPESGGTNAQFCDLTRRHKVVAFSHCSSATASSLKSATKETHWARKGMIL